MSWEVGESGKEDDCQRCAIILDEFSDMPMKQIALSDDTTAVGKAENEKGDHDRKIGGGRANEAPLPCQDLDALLQVDKGNVETEYVAGEARDIRQAIAAVRNSEDPMHYERPDANPGHEGEEVDPGRCHDVVYSV